MKYIIRVFLILLLPASLLAQSPTDVSVKREREFTGAGLYGYMNGGADLYLEYGVYKLTTKDLVYKGQEYTLDIYELPSPEDAYGIYSLHVFKCLRTDTLGCIDCLSAYQLQTVSNNKYYSMVFPSGFAAARKKADELLHLYVPADGAAPAIPEVLGLKTPYSGIVRFARGPLSASSVQPSLQDMLDGIKFTGLWHVTDKATKENRAFIYFSDNEMLSELKKRVPEADIIQSGEKLLYIKCREKEALPQSSSPFGF